MTATFERVCYRCSTARPPSDFASDAAKAACRECREAVNARRRERYASDPEARRRVLDRNKARADRNRSYERERSKAWHAANRDRANQASRDRYWSDPEAARADALRRYYADKSAVVNRNRTTRVRAYGNDVYQVTTRDINRLMARCGDQCVECGSTERLGIDHVIPVARGGRHSIGNLTVLCRRCNSSKKDQTFAEWRKRKATKASRRAA